MSDSSRTPPAPSTDGGETPRTQTDASTDGKTHVRIDESVIDVSKVVDQVRDHRAGATAVFVGSTRNHFTVNGKTKRVLTLEYEAYTPMALQETSRLCTLARTKWPALLHLAVQHRIGSCPVGEDSVCVATSSPHRRDALEACAWLIDELKASVPVWKKEVYEDGTKSWKANCECTRKMGPPPGVEV